MMLEIANQNGLLTEKVWQTAEDNSRLVFIETGAENDSDSDT